MRRKLFYLLCLFCLLVITVSGCGFKDIDKRFFVVSMGIDKAKDPDKKYRVMIKLAIPSSTEEFGASQSLIVREEGNNITDAVRLMKSKVDKELDFGHLKVIVFGESIVNEDISEVIDWFTRRRDIQRIAWVAMGKPDAESILDIHSKAERLPSNALILSFGQSGTESAYIVSEYLFDFRARLHEKGLDPFLPIIQPAPDENGMFKTDTAVILNKNKAKLVLNPDETKVVNALAFNLAKVDIKVGEGKETFMVSAENMQTKFDINTEGEKPVISLTLKVQGTIEESKSELFGSKLAHYEEMTNRYSGARLQKLLEKMQKANVDPIGFGLRYRATHFNNQNEWEEWKKLYPKAEFKVKVQTELRGTGIIQ